MCRSPLTFDEEKNHMSNASKTADEARRFEGRGGPRAALRALALDADLLAPADGGNSDAAKAMRVEIEQLLGELNLGEIETGKLLAVLDKHAPLDRLDDDDPHAERARELAGDNQLEVRPGTTGGRLGMDAAAAKAMDFEARHGALLGHIGGREFPVRRSAVACDSAARAKSFEERHPDVARLFT
jgi:hypothetical protein